jgi:acetylornithine deacetylase/succinyl-diaminopimelate desuccinylase-like protein
MRIPISLVVLLALFSNALTQTVSQDKVRAFRRANEHRILTEYVEFLSIPNVAADVPNIRRNASFILEMMKRRGLEPKLLEAGDQVTPPAVFAELKVPGATRTVLFYAHYDGQPTDPKQWKGSPPWQPVFRSAALESGGTDLPMPGPEQPINAEWRLYARSASDDKAGVMAILNALDALKANGVGPSSNIKFLFEGEEEAGSPHLGQIIERHRNLLEADLWLMCDGPVHQSGRKQVVFGVRGDVNVDITVYGAVRPLHSGHYGNWAPNPAMTLTKLLASMKDPSGRITVSGWYDDVEPLGQTERQAIADAPKYDDELRTQLGLAKTEGGNKTLLELISEPSLNINGISSADVGALARNIIPTTATAVLDLRLVKGNDHQRQVARLVDHIRKEGFLVLDREPTNEERQKHSLIAKVSSRPGGYNAERTRMDLPIAMSVIAAVESTSTEPVVKLPTSGGSLPLSVITERIKTVTISVPIVNFDNNQHAENENVRIQNLWDGIETMAVLMTMK